MINLGKYEIRKSRNNDKSQLRALFRENFGNMAERMGALLNLSDRYYVALYEGKIISVTGIIGPEKSDYQGYEITWTCTTRQHRQNGLVSHMLRQAIDDLPKDDLPIYCSCWRIKSDPINMKYVMNSIHMERCMTDIARRSAVHTVDCRSCPYYEKECSCVNDLYVLEERESDYDYPYMWP